MKDFILAYNDLIGVHNGRGGSAEKQETERSHFQIHEEAEREREPEMW